MHKFGNAISNSVSPLNAILGFTALHNLIIASVVETISAAQIQ